nr:hypothetical protein [Methanobrevibacter smithii]
MHSPAIETEGSNVTAGGNKGIIHVNDVEILPTFGIICSMRSPSREGRSPNSS